MRHEFDLSLDREQQEQFTNVNAVNFAFLMVISEDLHDCFALPFEFQHDLYEIY